MQNTLQNHLLFRVIAGSIALLSVLFLSSIAFAQSDRSKGKSADHRSTVAGVVEKLNSIANRDSGIGPEVSAVAKEQNESKAKVAEAMEKVETRSAFKTFLIGTDYKNLGAIRSEMVTTDNHIKRLEKALERVGNLDVVASLKEQIKTLKEEKTKIETFLKENESKFSVFGWFVKWLQ